ncbi:MAG: type IV secretion system DNA-binding domain-containing protein [Candidatus Aminicenantes bacterium]|nr:type IV secretion system DNA-binding domain-containing protein [Candidatus Aminicenantes bacterium]
MENSQKINRITPFALTDYRDIRKLFGIKQKNRRGHMYIIGKTGTGKSTLIENMAISDIKNGYGVALIDPHGDMAEEILDYIPKKRIKDIIYFNPADLDNPIAFNPLEKVPRDFHHLIASGIISTFKKIWSESWGPRLEHILSHSLLSLLEYPNSTLLDLPKLLTNNDFRKNVLTYITHPQVREFWLSEFEKYSAWLKSEAISPILNKIGQFLISIPLRNIVGQKENTFNVRQAMDEGKILIVNLAKGKIGEDNCSLLGALIVTKIQLAALSRTDQPEEQRKPFYFYVDEIHNFITLSFADILSESRKYGLNLILAHQYIEQLDERIRAAIFGNVGTIISFRIGAEDAKYLAQEFSPVFNEEDLIKLPNFHIYLKLMIDGVTSQPFSAITLKLREMNTSHKKEIIEFSRKQYTRPKSVVEQQMLSQPYHLHNSNGQQLSF